MSVDKLGAQVGSKMATRSITATTGMKGPLMLTDSITTRCTSQTKSTKKPPLKSLADTVKDSVSHADSSTLKGKMETFSNSQGANTSVSPTDLAQSQSPTHPVDPNVSLPPPPILPPGERDINVLVDAINKMHGTMVMNQIQLADKIEDRFTSLENKISTLNDSYEKQEASFRSLTRDMVKQADLDRVEGTLNNVASQADEKFSSIEQELDSLRNMITGLQTENLRLQRRMHHTEEKQNFNDIRAKRHSLTIEGLADLTDTNPKDQIIQKLNAEVDAALEEDDIVSARRLGKAMKAKRSRNISLTVRDDIVRDKILRCRGKLTVEIPNTPIWINEDVPASYRRRKSMLRDLVKVATANKYRAKIDQGGVSINGKLYLPHQFDCLPVGIRPQDIMCKRTVNDGLAFASEWAPLSNMYKTTIIYDGTSYGSAEQGYQHQRAIFEKKDDLAEQILLSSDPFECKKLGVEVGESPEWEASSETIMKDIVTAKFQQNGKLAEYLINTDDSQLYEATHDVFWGVGLPIHSQDTLDEKGKGSNKLGLILMALRLTYLETQSIGSGGATSQASLHPLLADPDPDNPPDTEDVTQTAQAEKL